MNLLCKLFAGSYENLWKAIIRPNRDQYSTKDLGPFKFELNSKYYKRTDIIIHNKRNMKLKCSFWEPFDEEREYEQLPCVIYLHGNSSSRLEALGIIKNLLPLNITVFAFDFSGSGKSDGDYISLGWHESDDVECVINFLKKTNKVSTIGLWGRSMGAATALIYGNRGSNNLSAILLDSAFYSLQKLIEELIEKSIKIPNFIINSMIETIRKTVLEKADFDIKEIEPYKFVKNCNIPALFCHAKEDSLINSHHCKDLYNIYPGEKNIYFLNGDHNTQREKEFKKIGSLFFYHNLNLNDLKINQNEYNLLNNNIINNDLIKKYNKLYNSYKFKTNLKLDNNNIDNNLKDNVNEKDENEKGIITEYSSIKNGNYFQKYSSNDLNEINKQNKKLILSSEIKDILKLSKNSSEKNIKKLNDIKELKPVNFKNIKKLKTSSSTQNIYFKKNVHNPFTKVNTRINRLANNCNLLDEMILIKNKLNYNNRYNNYDMITPTRNNDFYSENFRNSTKNLSIKSQNQNLGNITNTNIKKNNNNNINMNMNKNPFLFKFTMKKSVENEKQQKTSFQNHFSNSLSIKKYNIKPNFEKRWVIFEGINPYLKENKDYFKNKILKKENSVEDDNTIKNDVTVMDFKEEKLFKKKNF